MKKKILFLLIAVVTFLIGTSTVNAAVPTLSIKKTRVVDSDMSQENILLMTNIDDCTGGTFNTFYKLDSGDAVSAGTTSCIQGQLSVSISIPTTQLLNKAEHRIEFWITNSTSEESNHVTQDFIILKKYDSLVDNNGIVNLKTISAYINNLSVKTTKVTDQSILNRLGSSEVYKYSFKADDKDISYYLDKYGSDLIYPLITGTIKLPSTLTPDKTMRVYSVDENFNNIDTGTDCGSSTVCDGIFDTIPNILEKNNGNGYIFFKNGIYEYNDDSSTTNNSSTSTPKKVTNTVVKVPDTLANNSIIILIVGISLSIIGTIIIKKTLIKKEQ